MSPFFILTKSQLLFELALFAALAANNFFGGNAGLAALRRAND